MKVQAPNGRFYTRDHPHEIINHRVMRYDEIRSWLKELSTNPEYGWTRYGGRAALERALGVSPGAIRRVLSTHWIWPKQQVKFTARIKDIIEGRIVPRVVPTSPHEFDGVYVDPPEPPKLSKPKTIKMHALPGQGLKFGPNPKPKITLPAFKEIFENVPFWDPEKSE